MPKTLDIPRIDFASVQGRINRLWDPFERGPHHSIFGTTGSGKSYLIRHGILPLRPIARTVIIDVKGGRDKTWENYGTPVDSLPKGFGHDGDGPVGMRYRLIVNHAIAKKQLRRTLEQIRSEGHCIIVIDESRSITEREQMGLGSLVENIILEGRSNGISVIMGAQSTAWSVPSLKDQPAVFWIGQMRHLTQARELAKIAGYGSELTEVIRRVPPRTWLYGDNWEDEQILALTSVSSGK